MRVIPTRRLAPSVLLGLAVLYSACGDGDQRTEQITPGISSDSALKVLGSNVPESISADTLKNVWRRTKYLVNSKYVEVIYYSPNNEHWRAADTVPTAKVIPVVVVDGRVVGVGRQAFDSVAKIFHLPANIY